MNRVLKAGGEVYWLKKEQTRGRQEHRHGRDLGARFRGRAAGSR